MPAVLEVKKKRRYKERQEDRQARLVKREKNRGELQAQQRAADRERRRQAELLARSIFVEQKFLPLLQMVIQVRAEEELVRSLKKQDRIIEGWLIAERAQTVGQNMYLQLARVDDALKAGCEAIAPVLHGEYDQPLATLDVDLLLQNTLSLQDSVRPLIDLAERVQALYSEWLQCSEDQ